MKASKSKAATAADDYDEELFQALRALRKEIADSKGENGVPAFMIFSDAVLRAMARTAPTSLSALHAINGVGDKKLEEYGARFLAAIRAVRREAAEEA